MKEINLDDIKATIPHTAAKYILATMEVLDIKKTGKNIKVMLQLYQQGALDMLDALKE